MASATRSIPSRRVGQPHRKQFGACLPVSSDTIIIYIGDKMMMEQPLGEFLWYLFFDALHHRGQLSTYIRPMGGKVPSIYGPSGDEPGPAG